MQQNIQQIRRRLSAIGLVLALVMQAILFVSVPNPASAAGSGSLNYICLPQGTQGANGAQANSNNSNLASCLNNIYLVSLSIGGFIAVIMFVFAGYLYMTGTEKTVASAKRFMTTAIVGLLILFGAYAFLNTINPQITNIDAIVLHDVNCGSGSGVSGASSNCIISPQATGTAAPQPPSSAGQPGQQGQQGTANPPSTQPPGSKVATGTGTTLGACSDCVNLGTWSVPVKAQAAYNNGAFASGSLVDKLRVALASVSGWQVTEAYPPTVVHSDPCHNSGTCVDVTFVNPPTAQQLSDLCAAFQNAGLKVLNEYFNGNYWFQGSSCPAPRQFQTTQGNNLHISL